MFRWIVSAAALVAVLATPDTPKVGAQAVTCQYFEDSHFYGYCSLSVIEMSPLGANCIMVLDFYHSQASNCHFQARGWCNDDNVCDPDHAWSYAQDGWVPGYCRLTNNC